MEQEKYNMSINDSIPFFSLSLSHVSLKDKKNDIDGSGFPVVRTILNSRIQVMSVVFIRSDGSDKLNI